MQLKYIDGLNIRMKASLIKTDISMSNQKVLTEVLTEILTSLGMGFGAWDPYLPLWK